MYSMLAITSNVLRFSAVSYTLKLYVEVTPKWQITDQLLVCFGVHHKEVPLSKGYLIGEWK